MGVQIMRIADFAVGSAVVYHPLLTKILRKSKECKQDHVKLRLKWNGKLEDEA